MPIPEYPILFVRLSRVEGGFMWNLLTDVFREQYKPVTALAGPTGIHPTLDWGNKCILIGGWLAKSR